MFIVLCFCRKHSILCPLSQMDTIYRDIKKKEILDKGKGKDGIISSITRKRTKTTTNK